ncbi:hypothetical protein LCGC14_2228170 [marine sediment metagenome]|uniref:Uncharacterized protein n=1 Tax=marine sediment metagenome TaxID=412755 RepID=A0A0F9DWL7_9ZZZZ
MNGRPYKPEPVNSSTFKIPYGPGDEVEIGDISKDTFRPHAKLRKWGEECWIALSLPTADEAGPVLEDGKLKWKAGDQEVHFYATEPRNQQRLDGGFEFEVILNRKPRTNKIVLALESQGLSFYRQPEVLPKELRVKTVRPENVLGSYAVYHATKKPWHKNKAEADKYRACKAFHIYRPRIVDSNGWETWGELDIGADTLTVTIPQQFIDNATYPIRHAAGVDIGYDAKATSPMDVGDFINGIYDTPAAGGTLDTLTLWLYSWRSGGASMKWKCALYEEYTSHAFIAGTTEKTVDNDIDNRHWETFTFPATKPTLTVQQYGLFGWAEMDTAYMYYDLLPNRPGEYYDNVAYNGWPDPKSGVYYGGIWFTLYGTYTEEAAARRIFIT